MLTRLGINAVAAALIVPLFAMGNMLLSDATSGVVIPPAAFTLAVLAFALWSLGDIVVWLKEKRHDGHQ